jgi:HK97 family phage prohead protease
MATDTTAKSGQAVIRAFRQGIALRDASDGGMPTLFGHFAVFNRFTEIDSWFEGHFMEQIARGAFKKTFRERTPKVLFQHGQDPQVGDKPLGSIDSLAEDDEGAAYEVRMLDTTYNRELIPGLEAGLYGASFRFKVMREELVEEPGTSDQNPNGLPERTIKEAQVMEFGPVTFPAYDDASAGIRSLTDRFLFDAIERDPTRARELLEQPELLLAVAESLDSEDLPEDEDDQAGRSENTGRTLPSSDAATDAHPGRQPEPRNRGTSDAERREANRFRSREEWQQWLTKS